MEFKNGDCVLAWDADNGFILTGKLADVNIKDGEADLDFFNGGSCSPIGLEDCVLIPEFVGEFLQKALDAYPDEEEE